MVAISGSWGVLAPSLVALFREANRLAPNRSQSSDGSVGDLAHQQRVSDHNPAHGVVHALDLTHDPAGGWDAHARLEQLRQAHDPRVKYGISLSRIFRSYGYTPWEWQPYTGENPHDKHAHLSILDIPDAENDTRPWFSEEDDMTDEEHFWLQELHARKGTIDALAVMVADTQAHVKDVVEKYLADLASLPASGGGTVDVAALGKAIAADIAARLAA